MPAIYCILCLIFEQSPGLVLIIAGSGGGEDTSNYIMEDNRVKHETNQPQGQHLQAPAEQQMANRNIIVSPMGESELETLILIFGIILHIEA